ncbi:acyl-CoA N-acyltransferase [Coniochaeta sp. 2T2.1]|nr:acyl-CoA N-acyltransferase [Coniochaeta sp. 2T2.1]
MAERISVRKLRPTPEQVTEMITLHVETFFDTGLRRAFWKGGRKSVPAEHAFREGMMLRSLDNPNKHWLAVFLETPLPDGTTHNKIIGFAGWESPDTSGVVKTEEEKQAAREKDLSYRPDEMDKVVQGNFMAEMTPLFEKMGEDSPNGYWILWFLAVDPAHRRKGLARQLTQWGIDEAAKQGKGVILLATPIGLPFYKALGFIKEGEIVLGEETFTGLKIKPPTAPAVSS